MPAVVPTTMPATMPAPTRWRLADTVTMRTEPFGALLYDHRTRRLAFIRSAVLRRLIETMDSGRSAEHAMAELGVDAAQSPRMLTALAALTRRDLLVPAAAP